VSAQTWLALHPPWATARLAAHTRPVVVQSTVGENGGIEPGLGVHAPPEATGALVTAAESASEDVQPRAHAAVTSGTFWHCDAQVPP
jgi:hypothetical protein